MTLYLYIEGGGDSKEQHSRLREAYRKLLTKAGFAGRMPRTVAGGSRREAFDRYATAVENGQNAMVLVDSEDPVRSGVTCWDHVIARDGWLRPAHAQEDDMLLMQACMETWIVADHAALKAVFGPKLDTGALPPMNDLEQRHRHDILSRLERATRNCPGPYSKGNRSFDALAEIEPKLVEKHAPHLGIVMGKLKARS